MPKILITGNGFDLNFGLPTSYSDFIGTLNYVARNDNLNFHSVYSNCKNSKIIESNFKEFQFNKEKVLELKGLIQKNLWLDFFIDEYEIETWIDFELKIEYVLKLFFSSIEYINSNIFKNGPILDEKTVYTSLFFNHNIEIIVVLDKFKIIKKDNYNFTLNTEYLLKKYDFFVDLDFDKIAQDLINELNQFKDIFNLYFEIFVFPFYENINTKIDRTLFSKIDKHYTFNYTPTFEQIYKKHKITNFLHGKINSVKNEIVLGINEIPEVKIDKRYFLPFTKYFQRLNNKTDFKFIKEYENKLSSSYIFFFWGHSLDISDKDYIDTVFDFINKLKSIKSKIVVIYHSEASKSKLLLNLLNIRGKNDIENLMRSDKLLFIHIESSDLKKELNRDISSSNSNLVSFT